jgi:hypothetical protein
MTVFLAPGFSPNCRGPEVVQKPGWLEVSLCG